MDFRPCRFLSSSPSDDFFEESLKREKNPDDLREDPDRMLATSMLS